MKCFRQGDILLVEVSSLPDAVIQEQYGVCILARGEQTGHTHAVEEHGEIWVDVNDAGRRYLKVLRDTSLRHQEHGEISLKGPSAYRIVRQRMYLRQEIRHVAD